MVDHPGHLVLVWVALGCRRSALLVVLVARRSAAARHRRGRGRPRDQAARPRRCRRAGSSRSTARPATRRACCRPAGTSATGAGSTRSSRCRSSIVPPGEIALVVAADGAADPARAHPRPRGRRATTSRTPRAFLRSGGEQRPPARLPDRRHVPHQPGAVRRRHGRATPRSYGMTPDAAARVRRCRRTGSASSPRSTAARSPRATSPARSSPATTASSAAQAFIDARRLPRPAGAGAALGLVEPEPVVRAGRADRR